MKRAKQGLSKHGILKTKIGLICGKKKRGEEGEKRKKKRKRKKKEDSSQDQAKVWKLTLIMDSMRLCMNFHAWLVSSLSPNFGFF